MSGDLELPKPPPTWAIASAFATVYLCWGTTYFATSVAVHQEEMPPALFNGFRLSVAGSVLLLVQLARGQRLRLSGRDLLLVPIFSFCFFLCANLLVTIGQTKVSSGVTAILIATTPLWMGLIGMAIPGGERLSWRGWIGLAVGLVGIVLVKLDKDEGYNLLNDLWPLLALASSITWALGTVLSRHLTLSIDHLSSAAWQMVIGGVGQIVIGTWWGEWNQLPPLNRNIIFSFFYLLIAGSWLGFVAFNWLLGHVAAVKVGSYAYVNPMIAVIVGWCAGETKVHPALIAGIAVILVGVYLVRSDHVPSKEVELEPD
jgi:drug/metabolite transporter (DMT)-like permease